MAILKMIQAPKDSIQTLLIDRALQYIEAYFANLLVRVGLYNVSGELPIGERWLSFLSVVDYLGFRNCSGILSVDRLKV